MRLVSTNSPRAATCERRWNIGRRVRLDTDVYENTSSGRVNHEDGADNLMVKSKVLDFAPVKLPICKMELWDLCEMVPGDTILVWRAARAFGPVRPQAFVLFLSTGSRPGEAESKTGLRMRRRRMKTRWDQAASHTRRFSPSSPSAPVWARPQSPGR